MASDDKVNILLVDDQPAKLLSYEVILRGARREPDQGRVGAGGARASCSRHEIAVVLIDVCMPELDGFQLAAMIREHPRFQKTAIIFISAIHLTDVDRLRGYEMGAVDYVPVPVIPEVLRAKVRVFAELYRKTRQLEQLNAGAGAARRGANRGAGGLDRAAAAERAAPQPGAGRRPDGLVGLGSRHRRLHLGRRASIGFSASIPRRFEVDRRQHPGADPPRGLGAAAGCDRAGVRKTRRRFQTEFRVCRPNGADALVHRHGGGERRRRPTASCASAA